MNFNKLTEEEIEIIKQRRKEKSRLEIKIKNDNEKHWIASDNILLTMVDDKIKMSTASNRFFPPGGEFAGKLYSGNGYFGTIMSKEDVLKIRDFFNLYLDYNKEND